MMRETRRLTFHKSAISKNIEGDFFTDEKVKHIRGAIGKQLILNAR